MGTYPTENNMFKVHGKHNSKNEQYSSRRRYAGIVQVSFPAVIYLFKVTVETPEQYVKYIQNYL